MELNNNSESDWGSRRAYLTVLLCQMIGMPFFIGVTNTAIVFGSTGCMVAFIFINLFFGIPLLYMEFIISQFTARDCIDVWKIYPCVSHIGYIQVFWQAIIIIYNHLINSFIFHYLLISFENPIPYYTCGSWAKADCNMFKYNYTIHEDCIRQTNPPAYCDALFTTFPEYQYWRYNMLGQDKHTYQIAWRVCLSSGIICLITFLSCFKRKRSVKWVVEFFILVPLIGYTALLMGTILQKGVMEMYNDSVDYDFETFFKNFRISALMMPNIYCLGIGSGGNFNLASSSSFRAPCYSNTVVTVVVGAAVTTLAICLTAMMSCPYAFAYGVDPERLLKRSMSILYEKTPRFLCEYQQKYFWLVIVFSSHAALGIGTNLIYIFHLLEMLVARSPRAAKYTGLTSFLGIGVIYICTIPLLSGIGIRTFSRLRRCSGAIGVFIAAIETMVFIIGYGLDKFTEDVHFMQGLQPNKCTRLSWLVSSVVLSYIFINETIYQLQREKYLKHSSYYSFGRYVIFSTVGLIVIVFILKLLIAAFKNQFYDVFKLDRTWGPRSKVLQRSRAMFTAQAMTKEYLYRQYHLKAGIVARQKISNCRTVERDA